MRNRKATTADFLIAGFLFLLILAVVVPFINTIAISFSTQREYLNTPLLLIPREPTLNNYINLLGDERISIGYLTKPTKQSAGCFMGFLTGAGDPIRTDDLLITSELLYRLSHTSIWRLNQVPLSIIRNFLRSSSFF